ncbi:hypothetical protein LguiB_022435 [Lonicera macranthoides]
MFFGNGRILSRSWTRKLNNHRTIIVGLKSDSSGREMLLRLLALFATPGDNVLAVHVEEPNDTFDPNTFHLHEDLCKSKQVDFHIKICTGHSYIIELSHQVRLNFATILALGCSSRWPKDSSVSKCLKALPPTCSLLVMDNRGRILIQKQGTSQPGSANKSLQSSQSCLSKYAYTTCDQLGSDQFKKSVSMPCSSTLYSLLNNESTELQGAKQTLQLPHFVSQNMFNKLSKIEAKGTCRRFKLEELKCATNNFSPEFLIGESGKNSVYQAKLENGQAAAVKVFITTESSEEVLFQEVEILSGLKHENVIWLIGYCYCIEMNAVVYNLQKESLKRKLKELIWSERMRVAIGVAKALDYLHSCIPPVIHGDVKSSSILLSDNNCTPQLSDFGAATVHRQTQQISTYGKPLNVVGTLGYMAPEYMIYGKVNEKIDVYSYGVVLLELITGKEAIQKNPESTHESLVLWARSFLRCGLYECLIDPQLNEDYNKEEIKLMMVAARLCLLHSSSRRPTMKTILRLFEEPEYWLKMQRKREELLNEISTNGETGQYTDDNSDKNMVIDN